MKDVSSIEAARQLCEDLEKLVELAKQRRAPVSAISQVERACAELRAYLEQIAGARAWLLQLGHKAKK